VDEREVGQRRRIVLPAFQTRCVVGLISAVGGFRSTTMRGKSRSPASLGSLASTVGLGGGLDNLRLTDLN
jgi:hypothetical protein